MTGRAEHLYQHQALEQVDTGGIQWKTYRQIIVVNQEFKVSDGVAVETGSLALRAATISSAFRFRNRAVAGAAVEFHPPAPAATVLRRSNAPHGTGMPR